MVPTNKTAYETACQLAREQLARLDLSDVAFNSSARLEGETLYLDFLGETYQIEKRGMRITQANQEAKIGEQILILHYLVTADGTPLSRQDITFENIPGGQFYYPTYKARTIDYLIRISTKRLEPDTFVKAAEQIRGRIIESSGGVSSAQTMKIKLLALPNVPVTLIWWRGDKETGSNFQIIYDTSITHYLPLEDIVVITEQLVHKLAKIVKSKLPSCPLYDS